MHSPATFERGVGQATEPRSLSLLPVQRFAGVSPEVQRYVDGSCIIPTDGMWDGQVGDRQFLQRLIH